MRLPKATNATQQTASLFDHFVGQREQRRGNDEAERLCGLEVYHQLVLGRLLDRELGGLLTLQNAIDVVSSASI